MTVKRIVANITVDNLDAAKDFYSTLFGLDVVMDLGFIVTLASGRQAPVQISIATEGGSGTPVPYLSIEVDDVDAVYKKAKAARYEISYDLVDEPWGVRRFYVSDPIGNKINVLSHSK